jgi:hypothetical protein
MTLPVSDLLVAYRPAADGASAVANFPRADAQRPA